MLRMWGCRCGHGLLLVRTHIGTDFNSSVTNFNLFRSCMSCEDEGVCDVDMRVGFFLEEGCMSLFLEGWLYVFVRGRGVGGLRR